MAKKIKCIVKRPDEQFGHICNISDTIKNMQDTVGGFIEAIYLDNGAVLICNEEGKLRDMPYNFTCGQMLGAIPLQYPIFGTVIVCGIAEDEFDDVPIDFNEWKALLCEWGN